MPVTTDYPGVYVREIAGGPGSPVDVPTSVAAFVGRTEDGPVCEPTTVFSLAQYQRIFGAAPSADGLAWQVQAFFANGGGQAVIVRLVEPGDDPAAPLSVTTYLGDRNSRTGLYALDHVQAFNILCIPPDLADGDLPVAVRQAAADYCVARQAMLIVDPLQAWQQAFEQGRLVDITPDALDLSGPDQRRNAAVYFPRLVAPDPDNLDEPTATRVLPVCGALAGIWAATDVRSGVWKAPAGVDAAIADIVGLAAQLSDNDNGVLNPLGFNALRVFPTYGPVVWGARTLAGADPLADDYKYIPVRRLALYIEAWVAANLRWAVFQPNDERLWAAIRAQISAFLNDLWRQGALFGASLPQACFVICDASTTTPEDIEAGIVNILVGFAPVKPAEFVVLTIQQAAGQSD